ncbi:MAG: hypothetical protein JWM89_1838 [Acidimicrobiales bacterium]|nr:hypothetical protein [Acidimicrobiales bacterium]
MTWQEFTALVEVLAGTVTVLMILAVVVVDVGDWLSEHRSPAPTAPRTTRTVEITIAADARPALEAIARAEVAFRELAERRGEGKPP